MSITNVLCYWEKYSLGLLWIEIQLFGDQFTTCFNSLLLKYLTNKRRQTCLFSAPRIMQMSNSKKNSSMLNNSLIRWLTNITCLLFWSSKNWIVRLWSADCFIPHLPVKRGFSVNPGDFCMATVKPSRSLPKISVNETNGEGIEVLPSAFLTPKYGRNLRTTLQKHRSLFWP